MHRFDSKIINQAHQIVYGGSANALTPTDHYVQIDPQTPEDIALIDSLDLDVLDFRFEREIHAMGDYYHEATDSMDFPTLYTVVPPGFDFHGLSHQLLSPLVLSEDTAVVRKAFELVGDPQGYEKHDPPCGKEEESGGLVLLPCDGDGGGGSPPLTTNDCGCEVYTNVRKPGGCIRVQDTEKSTAGMPNTFEPVRRVRVIAKDGWFKIKKTYADDNGCWRINNEFSGKAWFWIKFRHDRAKIRGVADNMSRYFQWAMTVKDYVGQVDGPVFNNIETNYHMWTAQGSQAHRFWGAATVNNAVHEFYELAPTYGIATPPFLDIYTARGTSGGFAVMVNEIGKQGTIDALTDGMSLNPNTGLNILSPFAEFYNVTTALQIPINLFVRYVAPDVMIGTAYNRSDQLKRLAFHELAHASHYTNVGRFYWQDVIRAEVAADGHGNAQSIMAGQIAVVESWAEFLGKRMTHDIYGSQNSIPENWLADIEATKNEDPDHIPIGLYHDLSDSSNSKDFDAVSPPCDEDAPTNCSIVDDNVMGISISNMFIRLDGSTTTPRIFIDRIKLEAPTGNSQQAIENLFLSY